MLCRIHVIHIAESVYRGEYEVDQAAYDVIGRMGGTDYLYTHDRFDMSRQHKIDDTTEV